MENVDDNGIDEYTNPEEKKVILKNNYHLKLLTLKNYFNKNLFLSPPPTPPYRETSNTNFSNFVKKEITRGYKK